MDALLGFVCCFSVFAGIIWMGIRFLTGITEYIKSAMAGKNRAGAGVSARSIGSASQLGQKVQLNYINSRGEHRSAFVDANSAHKRGDRVKVDLWGNGGTMNLVYERIKNPEVLGLASPDPVSEPEPLPPVMEVEVEPPILHPKEFILGDPSGPELLYVRRDGNRGMIYFEPTSIEIVGNRVNLNPKGIDKRYAIALDQIINPEVLTPEKEPEPEVISTPPEPIAVEPEPVALTNEKGTRIILDKIPPDSFEAVQVMRRIKPEMGPFEIFDAFAYERETLLQGYSENRAKDIQEDLQNAGCTVSLQTVRPHAGTAIAEPPPQPAVKEEPEPPVIESPPGIGRPPTEDEFTKIRLAGFGGDESDFDEIKHLIESAPIDVNARDERGDPLLWGVQSTSILGLLMDHGADIHAKGDGDYGSSILHSVTMPMPAGVCKMLIQFGADINAQNQGGQTPLIRAASVGNYECAKILIEHGADIHVKNISEKTALQEAENHIWDGNEDYHRKAREGCEKIAALLRYMMPK